MIEVKISTDLFRNNNLYNNYIVILLFIEDVC